MIGKKGKKNQRRSGGSGGSNAATPKKFTAPTLGLEDVIFTWGTAKDATRFKEMDKSGEARWNAGLEALFRGFKSHVSARPARDRGTGSSSQRILGGYGVDHQDQQQHEQRGPAGRADPS
jgi:hypothetical protein